jgi:hypothetical protein
VAAGFRGLNLIERGRGGGKELTMELIAMIQKS